MASPMPVQQPSGNWGHYVQQQSMAAPTPNMDDFGSDRRLMGLKVNYTFDREAQVNFLARHPQPLHVNTIALSETKTIGYTDLSLCAQAIAQCSPELLGEDHDYTVYAFDYSEEDTPLVGQGLLSWILHADPSESKMIFGRLTKNPLALLPGGNGLKEMLEVKFKLLPTNRPPRRPDYGRHDVSASFDQTMPHVRQHDGVMTPTGSQEWDSFLQSNPQLGQHQNLNNPSALPGDQSFDGPNRVAPTLVDTQGDDAANPPSRPASRASTTSTTKRKRTRIPTGRPRGRPPNPKKNAVTVDTLHSQGPGSTSGYEEGTDAEESAPAKKKRATTTAVTKNINDPFGGSAGPESLRVAASTAGSIRTLRPPGAGGETTQGNHLQDVPRAPTPIPAAGPRRAQGGRGAGASSLRRQSTLSQAAIAAEQNPSFTESVSAMSPPSQDGRSPGESEIASPVYSDSPGQIGSSPPVPRVTAYIRSSPPASSPTLPPMPKPQPDSGFMSGDIDDLFDEQSKPFKLEPTSQPASRPIPRASDRQKIPGVLIHELRQTRPASSDVEMVLHADSQPPYASNARPTLPSPAPTYGPPAHPYRPPAPPASLNRSKSDSHALMAPPAAQVGLKDPSPQLEEPAVAVDRDMAKAAPAAPTQETPMPSVEDQGDNGHPVHIQQMITSQRPLDERQSTESRTPSENQRPSAHPTENPAPQEQELMQRLAAVARDASESEGSLPPASTAIDLFARPLPPNARQHSRPATTTSQPQLAAIPASDPIGSLALPGAVDTSFSEAPAPKSPKSPRSNKNLVKKAVIRLRLEEAIAAGQMPAYCTNCGAIETPTWRKIWTQERFGVPEFCEFSEKPGKITAIIVLERDMDDNPSKYQLIKKGLGEKDNKEEWVESLLCNPCGIWLAKWKIHRPPDKWDRGQQPKTRRRGRATRNPKRSKGAAEATSEAAFETDPAGPEGMDGPSEDNSKTLHVASVDDTNSREASLALEQALRNDLLSPAKQHRSRHGSTHSRGSGTAKSPIMVGASAEEAIMGATRRLLFPSPRKDGQVKVLNEVAINVIQLDASEVETRDRDTKGPRAPQQHGQLTVPDDDDELEALFRSPMARPSTPPTQDGNHPGPFKTPTRPTPSHRPVTRSISKSIKSGRSRPSPAQALAMLQATPTRTPRSLARVLGGESPSLRRSPRFTGHDDLTLALLETPMTRSISQMLSDYGVEDDGLGFGSIAGMPELEGLDDIPFDFGSLLGSDATAASSPSKAKRGTGFDYAGTDHMWTEWNKGATTEPQE
ncbi:conserved hypothetical protein [Verticillium alfalfae VaMs.102]|uniref:Ams2/SPT21 N-terminal domain-containing protein n=1 Tax=Verticillium alfalfae (strain VaMs.102 / ATCC MYA-4576 / FGSC 10136) TaxID=526221 RepID=C9SRJ6_VERA1|nr:conserved hypothetical protein [Verticillium alfalfae VaMs.102]EEY21411.1 conserved hypothetical protein [Verticillium alfalfae VaMs.102]